MKPIICILGPSGVGKSFYIGLLIKKFNLEIPMTVTSRSARLDDTHHSYAKKEEFEAMLRKNEFLELDEYNGNYYGITRSEFGRALGSGLNNGVIMELTTDGYRQIKKAHSDAVAIALVPDDISWLRDRLIEREMNDAIEIEERMKISRRKLKEIRRVTNYIVICKNDPKTTMSTLEEISDIIDIIIKLNKKYP